jgi:hypothetical protein
MKEYITNHGFHIELQNWKSNVLRMPRSRKNPIPNSPLPTEWTKIFGEILQTLPRNRNWPPFLRRGRMTMKTDPNVSNILITDNERVRASGVWRSWDEGCEGVQSCGGLKQLSCALAPRNVAKVVVQPSRGNPFMSSEKIKALWLKFPKF